MPQPAKTSAKQIVAIALDIVEKEGAEALSMREVARRLQLAANALYHHYPDRTGLEESVATEGLRRLYVRLKRAMGGGTPRQDAQRLAEAYLRFARAHWSLYSMMMQRRPKSKERAELDRKIRALVDGTLEQIAGPDQVQRAACSMWALLHGIVVLEQNVLLPEDREHMVPDFAIGALLHGLERSRQNTSHQPLIRPR